MRVFARWIKSEAVYDGPQTRIYLIFLVFETYSVPGSSTMNSASRNLRLSTLALEHAPLLESTRDHVALALREIAWDSYDGARFLLDCVFRGRVSMLEFAHHAEFDRVRSTLHSEGCRGLLLAAFSKSKSKRAHKRVLQWIIKHVDAPVIRDMSMRGIVNDNDEVETLDAVAYDSGWASSFHDLVDRDLATANLLVAADYGHLQLLEKELEPTGLLEDEDTRIAFLRLATKFCDLEYFLDLVELLHCEKYALSALVIDNSGILEPYLEHRLTHGPAFMRKHIGSALANAVWLEQKQAFDTVAKRFLEKLTRVEFLAGFFKTHGVDEIQREWETKFSNLFWTKWTRISGNVSSRRFGKPLTEHWFCTPFAGPIAGHESRKRKRSSENINGVRWVSEEMIEELTEFVAY